MLLHVTTKKTELALSPSPILILYFPSQNSITMQHLLVDTRKSQAPTRDLPHGHAHPQSLPPAKEIKPHPLAPGGENASLFFVGTATTILYVMRSFKLLGSERLMAG
jgi:hypothetical protein